MPKGYPSRKVRKTETKPRHMWTKDEIKRLLSIWEDSTLSEICEEMGLDQKQIGCLRYDLKQCGYTLTRKKAYGERRLMCAEVLRELKLIK